MAIGPPVDRRGSPATSGSPSRSDLGGRGGAGGAPTAAEERARMLDLIEFDSEGPARAAFLAAATLGHDLSEFVDIPWPGGLAPIPAWLRPG